MSDELAAIVFVVGALIVGIWFAATIYHNAFHEGWMAGFHRGAWLGHKCGTRAPDAERELQEFKETEVRR